MSKDVVVRDLVVTGEDSVVTYEPGGLRALRPRCGLCHGHTMAGLGPRGRGEPQSRIGGNVFLFFFMIKY